jgi:hypothetical protein
MSPDDSQRTWAEYYQRKKAERIGETRKITEMMRLAGVSDDTVLVLDFVHFGTSRSMRITAFSTSYELERDNHG